MVAHDYEMRISGPYHEESAPLQAGPELEKLPEAAKAQTGVQVRVTVDLGKLARPRQHFSLIAGRQALHRSPKTGITKNLHAMRLSVPALRSLSIRFTVLR